MMKSQFKRKNIFVGLAGVIITALIVALTFGIFGLVKGKGGDATADQNGTGAKFTFGQTYTIGGREYKLGNGEGEYIDYNAALGLDGSATVKLTKFTYIDGTDGTAETFGVRNAGSYEFEVTAYDGNGDIVTYDEAVAVATQEIHFDVNKLKNFVNARSAQQWEAHGDITTIYQLNDAWYSVIIGNETVVNSKTITNSYYVLLNSGDPIAIKMKDEILDGGYTTGSAGNTYNNPIATSSTYEYNDGQTTLNFVITNRTGIQFTYSGEYIASYTMTLSEADKNNYSFIYNDESKLTNSYKGLDVPLKTRDGQSFVLTKHWYILNSNDMLIQEGVSGNEPYVPFFLNDKAVDTVTFTDDVFVTESDLALSNEVENSRRVEFAIDYVPTGGSLNDTVTIKSRTVLEHAKKYTHTYKVMFNDLKTEYYTKVTGEDAEKLNVENTIDYYINSSMPAGTYTLYIYVDYQKTVNGAATPAMITGEYKLYVLPKALNATLIDGIKTAMNGATLNSYASGTDKLHESIDTQKSALEATLNKLGANGDGGSIFDEGLNNYWSNLSHKEDYYDTLVTILYNNSAWNINSFASLSETITNLGSNVGMFTFYFSVSARNYLTTGGADDPNYANYTFDTKLATEITSIYDYILGKDGYKGYFLPVTYTGAEVFTLVPASGDYYYNFDSSKNQGGRGYVVKGEVTVTLTLSNVEYTKWGEIPDGLKSKVVLSQDANSLIITWEIVPATNSYKLYPQISPWDYNGFNANTNLITSTLTFVDGDGATSQIYYRIGKQDGSGWIEVYDEQTNPTEYAYVDGSGTYFTLDESGKVPAAVATVLNNLSKGGYRIGSHVDARSDGNVNGFTQTDYFNTFEVGQASNSWVTSPNMTNWAYNGFATSYFTPGVPTFGTAKDIIYKLTVDGKSITFTYGGEDESGKMIILSDDSDDMVETLNALHAKSYTITVSQADTENYFGASATVNFSVTQARNSWSVNPAIGSWVYAQFDDGDTDGSFTLGTASFGTDTAVYTVYKSGNPTPEFTVDFRIGGSKSDILNGLKALGAGNYSLNVTLADTDDYASAPEKNLNFTVSKADNAWTNGDGPAIDGWYYGAYSATANAPKNLGAVNDTGNAASVEYFKASAAGAKGEKYEGNLADVPAGYYVMQVTVAGNDNYNDLVANVQFTVLSSENSWVDGKQAEARLEWTWGSDTITNLQNTVLSGTNLVTATAKFADAGIEYTVLNTDKNTSYSLTVANDKQDRTELIEYLGGLVVGNYSVTVTVNATNDYGYLQSVTYIVISPAKFKINTEPSSTGWTWSDGYNNAAAGGKNFTDVSFDKVLTTDKPTLSYCIINGNNRSKEYDTCAEMTQDLYARDAGTYQVEIVLSCDNYGTVTYTVEVEISRVENSWTTALSDYTTTGEIEVGTGEGQFKLAKAQISTILLGEGKENEYDLLRYDVIQLGGTGWYNLTEAAFEDRLAELKAGVYTVIARVGGEGFDLSDENLSRALKIYNANYKLDATSCTVNLSLGENEWLKELEMGVTWEWGNHAKLDELAKEENRPRAQYGNDTVVYTIRKGGEVQGTYSATDGQYGNAQKAYAAMIARLKTLDVGAYSLTVTIEGTTEYSAPKPLTVTFEITISTTIWDEDTNGYETSYSWTYGNPTDEDGNDLIDTIKKNAPVLDDSVPPQDGWGEITYKIGQTTYGSWEQAVDALQNASAGVYVLTASVAGNVNHTPLEFTVTVTVSVAANEWSGGNDGSGNEYVQPNEDGSPVSVTWIYGASDNKNILFKSAHGEITYTVNGSPVTTDLNTYLKTLGAGTYTIVASVAEDDEYASLSVTVELTIDKATNKWTESYESLAESLTFTGKSTKNVWQWGTSVTFNGVTFVYKSDITVIIKEYDSETSKRTFTYNPANSSDAKAVMGRLNKYLSAVLDEDNTSILYDGKYVMIITVPESANYYAVSEEFEFEITQAANGWSVTPALGGSAKLVGDRYVWTYGETATETATPKFGEYKVTYKNAATGTQSNVMPTDAGSYVATFTVEGTNYYSGLTEEIKFDIGKKSETGFDRAPSVIVWSWNGYDATVNLFTCMPKSGGAVEFTVLDSGKNEVKDSNGNAIKFRLVNAQGVHTGNYSEDVYVEADVAKELNKLTQGNYYLKVSVEETDNYKQFTDDMTPFSVGLAANNWVQTPQIMTWSLGKFDEEENLPVAEAVYGNVTIVIVSKVGNLVYYDVTYKFNEASLYDVSLNKYELIIRTGTDVLGTADVGKYTMTVTVEGESGKYDGLNTQTLQFEVYIMGSATDENFWKTNPSIEDWVADIGKYNDPTGEPARGKAYFHFYEMVWDEENSSWKQGAFIDKDYDGAELVDKSQYYEPFYIPTKPGRYYMYGLAMNPVEGYEDDYLDEDVRYRSSFEIYYREIKWEQTVIIASTLRLGEMSAWQKPTALTSLDKVVNPNDPVTYEFKYYDYMTNALIGTEIPTEVGRYYVIATASARFTDKITSRADFNVELSQNRWLYGSSPSIESWSEEDIEIPDPDGWVAHGTIVYTYINKARPNEILHEKPTEAGNYIMYATVELEGYETLTASYEFTIAPAFDITLLTIDIALASIACILAVVAIIFAIRRYRENG